MKAPELPTPLADRLNMAPWLYDLIMAGLGSVGLNGLGCGLLVFGAHGFHRHAGAAQVCRNGNCTLDRATTQGVQDFGPHPPSTEAAHPQELP